LPDEQQRWQLTTANLLSVVDGLGIDEGAKLFLLLWRTWQVCNNLVHDAEKLSIENSIGFLRKYWSELCDAQQHSHPFDANGKRPVLETLIAGEQGARVREMSKWKPP
jgi:hypothetical protein